MSGRRRSGSRRVAVVAVAVAVLGAGAWVSAHQRASGTAAAEAGGGPGTGTGTAAVVRRDLQGREEVQGTLGYGDPVEAVNQRRGTVTWLPAEGATVRRGRALYRVDDLPVPLLYGGLPFWRDLSVRVDDGRDVEQLERNLAALGYDPGTIDRHYSWATREAVAAWQEDLGLPETGSFGAADAVVADGPVRVGEPRSRVGAPAAPGQALLSLTPTSRQVSADVETSRLAGLEVGDRVRITLPGGATTGGKVTGIGKVAERQQDQGGDPGGGEASEATVPVTISLDRPEDSGDLDQAPVDVDITTETRKDVLAVPVAALLALAEGGYAVEVAGADGGRRLAGVRLGLFADGLVEVSGGGLAEGMRVVVPQ